ncbi:hypothetical protein F8M41_000884 [Gigaspora margarita]|uniref:Uncharacterized protein n=1 Tax=Gigaspora margarita TaxID=4874 RepID=A0A8H4AAK0_GIGMA|nr:hypothetical protein F8M41_000884 [Gigaspora margarita]
MAYRKKKKKVQDEHCYIKEIFKENPKNISAMNSTEIDNSKLHYMFTIWIIKCQRQFSIIEDSELVEIVQYLNPKAELVKADTIKIYLNHFIIWEKDN